jgi:ribose transport system permease protein
MKSNFSTKYNLGTILSSFAPFIGLAFVCLLFWFLCPPAFYSFYNVKTILTQSVIIGIASLGMTYVIISGGIDLSVGSQIAFGTIITALLINSGMPVFVAALGAIVGCGLVGLFNATLITRFNLLPFIVTLGSMQIVRGMAKWFGKEQTIVTSQNGLNGLMLVDPSPSWMVFAPGIWLMLFLFILSYLVLKYTVLGRYTFAIGSNEQTARLCGIPVGHYKTFIYIICGLLTGVASVLQFSYITVGDPTSAAGLELDIIAAVVIGGGSLSGGEGSALGSILGAIMMAVLRNGCNMLGVPNYVQEILIGAIIVSAVLIDQQKRRLSAVS